MDYGRSHATYFIDFINEKIIYASKNMQDYIGGSVEHINDSGIIIFANFIPRNDKQLIYKITKAAYAFYNKLPNDKKISHQLYYDFNLKKGNRTILINHKFTPLYISKEGYLTLASLDHPLKKLPVMQ